MLRTDLRPLALGAGLIAAISAAPAVASPRQLPVETSIPVTLQTTVSSATSRPEDRVDARVRADVLSGGRVVIPAGSELRGHVVSVRRAAHVKGRAYLSMSFNELVANGKTYRISARRIGAVGPRSLGRDAKFIGGGAGAGAVVGALVDGKEGAAKGALVGAGAGTGALLATRGKEVTFASGSRWRVRLVRPLEID
jgi:hypothetical protein